MLCFAGNRAGHLNEVGPHVLVLDPAEGLAEFDRFFAGHEVDVDRRDLADFRSLDFPRHIFEKEADWYAQILLKNTP